MRYLILSDLHGNLPALEAVMESVRGERFDSILVLGDLVGYGADPNQVVETVRKLRPDVRAIRGNHDKAVAFSAAESGFNVVARQAAEWTAERLEPENLDFVRRLPQGPLQIEEDLWICHGTPLDEDAYLLSPAGAAEIFALYDGAVTFFGHTHIASAFVQSDGSIKIAVPQGEELELDLRDGERYLLNPGSVGQPRDRDPRASFMTYDSGTGTARWHRVEYDVESAQAGIRAAGLPGVLADRLSLGI